MGWLWFFANGDDLTPAPKEPEETELVCSRAVLLALPGTCSLNAPYLVGTTTVTPSCGMFWTGELWSRVWWLRLRKLFQPTTVETFTNQKGDHCSSLHSKTDRVEQFGGNKIVMIMSTSNTDYLKLSCNITSGRESKSQVQNVWTVVVQLIWLISQVFDGVSCGFVRHIHRHDYCSWVVHELWGHNGKSIGCGCSVCVSEHIYIYIYTIYPKRAYLSTRKRRCVQPSGAPFLNNPSLCDSAV